MDKELCVCGKHYGHPVKVSPSHYCYDKIYKLEPLIEGKERISGQRVLKHTTQSKEMKRGE